MMVALTLAKIGNTTLRPATTVRKPNRKMAILDLIQIAQAMPEADKPAAYGFEEQESWNLKGRDYK